MTFLQVFFQAFVVGFSGAIMPGPLLTYDIQLTYKKGFWVGPQLVLGHAILEGLLVVGLLLGLGQFIRLSLVRIILGIVGGLVLAWMGADLIRSQRKVTCQGLELAAKETAAGEDLGPIPGNSSVAPNGGSGGLHPVVAGAVISVSNPYWSLWWSMLGLALITQAFSLGWPGVGVFFSGHILSDLIWYSFISLAIAKGRRFIPDAFYRWLMIGCGVLLLIFAVIFLYNAMLMMGIIPDYYQQTIDLFQRLRAWI